MFDEATNAFKMGSEPVVSNLNQHHPQDAVRKTSFPYRIAEPKSGAAQAKSSLCPWEWAALPQFPLVLKLLYHLSLLVRMQCGLSLLCIFSCSASTSGQQVYSYPWILLCSL